jgi:hypothetical protein
MNDERPPADPRSVVSRAPFLQIYMCIREKTRALRENVKEIGIERIDPVRVAIETGDFPSLALIASRRIVIVVNFIHGTDSEMRSTIVGLPRVITLVGYKNSFAEALQEGQIAELDQSGI